MEIPMNSSNRTNRIVPLKENGADSKAGGWLVLSRVPAHIFAHNKRLSCFLPSQTPLKSTVAARPPFTHRENASESPLPVAHPRPRPVTGDPPTWFAELYAGPGAQIPEISHASVLEAAASFDRGLPGLSRSVDCDPPYSSSFGTIRGEPRELAAFVAPSPGTRISLTPGVPRSTDPVFRDEHLSWLDSALRAVDGSEGSIRAFLDLIYSHSSDEPTRRSGDAVPDFHLPNGAHDADFEDFMLSDGGVDMLICEVPSYTGDLSFLEAPASATSGCKERILARDCDGGQRDTPPAADAESLWAFRNRHILRLLDLEMDDSQLQSRMPLFDADTDDFETTTDKYAERSAPTSASPGCDTPAHIPGPDGDTPPTADTDTESPWAFRNRHILGLMEVELDGPQPQTPLFDADDIETAPHTCAERSSPARAWASPGCGMPAPVPARDGDTPPAAAASESLWEFQNRHILRLMELEMDDSPPPQTPSFDADHCETAPDTPAERSGTDERREQWESLEALDSTLDMLSPLLAQSPCSDPFAASSPATLEHDDTTGYRFKFGVSSSSDSQAPLSRAAGVGLRTPAKATGARRWPSLSPSTPGSPPRCTHKPSFKRRCVPPRDCDIDAVLACACTRTEARPKLFHRNRACRWGGSCAAHVPRGAERAHLRAVHGLPGPATAEVASCPWERCGATATAQERADPGDWLLRHVLRAHFDMEAVRCPFCPFKRRFATVEALRRHLAQRLGGGRVIGSSRESSLSCDISAVQ
ncbi:hypothetical protein GGX14DRAFT_405753 [Mycena pura]|uniref:Uncharacterized protein n=1 Tax=Mycena pura TaxID=153505 RepID=A0AAD6URC1_9AGAR|nr:hypothetical protein GGX14DRAFT_405753 [Mycena pura]